MVQGWGKVVSRILEPERDVGGEFCWRWEKCVGDVEAVELAGIGKLVREVDEEDSCAGADVCNAGGWS